MFLTILPAVLMGNVHSYSQLITYGFFIGIGLASFSVGVGFVSGWYSAAKQGTALGVYGAGNIGQSLAAFGSPFIAAAFGMRWGFWTFGVLLSVWFLIFAVFARNAPQESSTEVVRRHDAAPRKLSQLDFEPLLLPDIWRLRGNGSLSADLSNRVFQVDPAASWSSDCWIRCTWLPRPGPWAAFLPTKLVVAQSLSGCSRQLRCSASFLPVP